VINSLFAVVYNIINGTLAKKYTFCCVVCKGTQVRRRIAFAKKILCIMRDLGEVTQ